MLHFHITQRIIFNKLQIMETIYCPFLSFKFHKLNFFLLLFIPLSFSFNYSDPFYIIVSILQREKVQHTSHCNFIMHILIRKSAALYL